MIDDLYRDILLEHYKNPRYFGKLENADVKVREKNSSCGDEISLSLKLKTNKAKLKSNIQREREEIGEIRFEGQGCAVSVAFTSMLIEYVLEKGLSVGEINHLGEDELLALVGLDRISPTRKKCAMLGLSALKKAVGEIK